MQELQSKLVYLSIVLGVIASGTSIVNAATINPASPSSPIVLNQTDLKFKPAPGLPPGIQIAHIRGDLAKHEPYTFRFLIPNCYVIPAHWHTNDEEVTVI